MALEGKDPKSPSRGETVKEGRQHEKQNREGKSGFIKSDHLRT